MFDYQLGGDLQYYLPWGFECSSDQKQFLRTEDMDRLATGGELTTELSKKKYLILRFKFYDILRQDILRMYNLRHTCHNVMRKTDWGRYFTTRILLFKHMAKIKCKSDGDLSTLRLNTDDISKLGR